MEQKDTVAVVLMVVAVADLLAVPILRSRTRGQAQLLVTLAMFSSSMIVAGLAAAFHFGLIPLGH